MRKTVNLWLAFLLVLYGVIATADSMASIDSEFKPDYKPSLHITRTTGEISIDGLLSDPGWKNAARAGSFVEASPGDQIKPPVESAALMTYDDTHLYVALIAYDDPSTVRASLRDRDEIFRDDYFGIMLDTYGDYSWGYEIFVNPFGIQGDLRILASGGEDGSFDIVYESRGMVTDSGYQVELAIPFSSLRFPDAPEQKWRLNFWRDHQREVRRRYSWTAQDRDNPCFVCQWGELTGIENVKPSSNIDILPNIVAFQSGRRPISENTDLPHPDSSINNGDPDAELSLNARYGISSNSSVEVTINPDFSQVESDAAQVDVNTTFGLSFPERRPFFQEGSDLFRTFAGVIYTRSINDPEWAAKFTGRFGRTGIAYLMARDENTPILIPLEERTSFGAADQSFSNIFRLRHSIWQDSHLGLILTDRRIDDFENEGQTQKGGAGSLYGVDGSLRLVRRFQWQFQLLGSRTEEIGSPDKTATDLEMFNKGRNTVALDGETFDGFFMYQNLNYSTRYFGANLFYEDKSPAFRADNGIVTRSGTRMINYENSVNFQPNGEWVVDWGTSVSLGRLWNSEGYFKDEWVNPRIYLTTKNQTSISVHYMNSRERFRSILFEGISQIDFEIDSRFSEILSGGFGMEYGKRIYRHEPQMADKIAYEVYANFKPNQRLFIQPNIEYIKLDNRTDGSNLVKGYITRTRATYQINREWFVRLIFQYNDFDNRFDIEPLLTYKVNPFTVFYVGSTSGYWQIDPASDNSLEQRSWKVGDRQFFAKLQYLIRI